MVTTLVNFRNIEGLSQKELADKLGVTLSFYSKIEIGLRNPSFNFIMKFKSNFPTADINKIFFENKQHEMCT